MPEFVFLAERFRIETLQTGLAIYITMAVILVGSLVALLKHSRGPASRKELVQRVSGFVVTTLLGHWLGRFRGLHCNVALVDGSIGTFSWRIDPAVLKVFLAVPNDRTATISEE